MNIVDFIPHGYESAVSREKLVEATGLSDRVVRKMIEEARKNGALIVNKQNGRGYYRASSETDLLEQYKQNNSRAKSILVQQKYIRAELKKKGIKVK